VRRGSRSAGREDGGLVWEVEARRRERAACVEREERMADVWRVRWDLRVDTAWVLAR